MKTIDRLVAEHDIIERGLNLLEMAVTRIDAGEPLPEGFSAFAPEFFADFADRCHHAKEEELLFPLLKRRGIPEQGGPIGVMLHEHDAGRACVRRMRASGQSGFESSSFSAAAKEFIPLLRQHIFKENNILFQMAGNVMSSADDAALDEQFTRVEAERELAGMHERFAAAVARWEGAFK